MKYMVDPLGVNKKILHNEMNVKKNAISFLFLVLSLKKLEDIPSNFIIIKTVHYSIYLFPLNKLI